VYRNAAIFKLVRALDHISLPLKFNDIQMVQELSR